MKGLVSFYKSVLLVVSLSVCMFFNSSVFAASEFNFKQATPQGSWSVREEVTTDHKGKQMLAVVKTSMVGKENLAGKAYYWVEMELQNYKLKKGKRKPKGDKSIMKVLIDSDAFSGSPANVVNNLNKYAKTVIMQTGDATPMKVEQGGMLAKTMMDAFGVTMEFDYSVQGSKKVTVPAGEFSCKTLNGSAYTETKALIKTLKIRSENESCFADTVPFGLVYANTKINTNGKDSLVESKLVQFGKSGAVSAITETPTEMPAMPKLF